MKIMRNFIILASFFIVTACYEEKVWLDNNVDYLGKAVPSIYMYPLDSTTFTPGRTTRVQLEYFSNDGMKEIKVYQRVGSATAARTLVTTLPYTPAFSRLKQQDTLIYQFPVPTGNAINTQIFIDAEAVSTKDVPKGTWQPTASSRSFRTKK
jgi:hypothetical protein